MTKTIPEIYEEIRSEVKVSCPDVVQSLPKYGSWQAHLYRERAKMVPKLSSTAFDLNISGKWSLTESDDDFVIANETVDKKRILIFGTKENLYRMCMSTLICMDGTYLICFVNYI